MDEKLCPKCGLPLIRIKSRVSLREARFPKEIYTKIDRWGCLKCSYEGEVIR